ncbi:hypothetical protein HPB50_013256 [Hyalomma asiaticum]|uniref:Uncharacterized protein n=1 Tax=Hyalomma asiaticum TaxID=266040 RepID=A0ACB7TFV0_HYAAI|nr:hypothetical protein HPB50_013256 [Hyalomma asiaticum]
MARPLQEERLDVSLSPGNMCESRFTDIVRKRWRAEGLTDKGSTTRLVTLKLNAGAKIVDLRLQLTVSALRSAFAAGARAISAASAAFCICVVVFVCDSVTKTASVNERTPA